jgi:pyridoxine 5-phosphate synthase
MARLSVNINKIATLRNARGGNLPDLCQVARDCEAFGAEGITVHPRPDQRHIRYADVPLLKQIVTTEFNIEGNPNAEFMDLVLQNRPAQATLVPDADDALTSDAGWNTVKNADFLTEIIAELKKNKIRVSVFMDCDARFIEGAAKCGADRIEFYTGNYAKNFAKNREKAVAEFVVASKIAQQNGLGINAGHDLNLENLRYFKEKIPALLEVSIGHALISDALYFGLQNTIGMYRRQLR